VLRTIYLDHNATTPLYPDLKSRVGDWLVEWGNPSSIHFAGRGPKALIREARHNLASLIGADQMEIIFTSGGSEANNLAIKGVLGAGPKDGRDQILISSVEHPSVRKTAEYMTSLGYRLDLIPVHRDGEMDLDRFDDLLSEQTALVSVMLANNETGHLFPINHIAEQAKRKGALVHCDAVQALGKIPLNVRTLGVDLATFSGHKFYALKGCGVLYVKKGTNLIPQIHGGGQERGRRAGTENALAIASFGYMCSLGDKIFSEALRLRQLRDHMERRIVNEITGVQLTGAEGVRLPNTSNMTLSDIDGETLLMNLDVHGFAVSTGAACSSGNPEPSPVLLAMGLSRGEAQCSLRLSLGWENTQEDVDSFVEVLKSVVVRLRGFQHGAQFLYGV
jgi:cysteine desulfurase